MLFISAYRAPPCFYLFILFLLVLSCHIEGMVSFKKIFMGLAAGGFPLVAESRVCSLQWLLLLWLPGSVVLAEGP